MGQTIAVWFWVCTDKDVHYETELVAGCLNWCVGGEAGRGLKLIRRSLFGKKYVFRCEGEEMGRGCGEARQRQGRLMKLCGCISQTASTGPDLQPVLFAPVTYSLACLWVKLLRPSQQLEAVLPGPTFQIFLHYLSNLLGYTG